MTSDIKDVNKKIETSLSEVGLNTQYRNFIRVADAGLIGYPSLPEVTLRNRFADAERCFRDPQVFASFHLSVFALLNKKLEWIV